MSTGDNNSCTRCLAELADISCEAKLQHAVGNIASRYGLTSAAYLWIDATYLKVRRGGRIVSVAVIIAVGVNSDGRRESLDMEIGTSEVEPIWTEFLRMLMRRGLRGLKLVTSDAHEGIKATVSKVLCATWQRCRFHFMRNALAHMPARADGASSRPSSPPPSRRRRWKPRA